MADLIIPAALRIWLIFLLIFIFLDYPVPFSIIFGAIGGISGGIVSAWWQMKGGAPAKGASPNTNNNRQSSDGNDGGSRWAAPFLRQNTAQKRYMERKQKARRRRLDK